MIKKKNSTIKEIFTLAFQNHQKTNFQTAKKLYEKVLKVNPNHFESILLLGSLSAQMKNFDEAKQLINKAIKINPNHQVSYNNLGNVFKETGEFQNAVQNYQKAIKINPNFAEAHYNLGIVLKELGKLQNAIKSYQKAIKINPNYAEAMNNLGIAYQELGEKEKAIKRYKKAIKINPNYAETMNNLGVEAMNNLGIVYQELGEKEKAIKCYQQAIKINPNYSNAYFGLHSFAPNIDEALKILEKLYSVDNKFLKAKIMISALKYIKGNFNDYNALIASPESNHPFTRSVKWVFSLPHLPKIFFNRWSFFDGVVELADKSRPFYEFGVWNGISFKYLIKTFRRGFGFDTFTGLPETWGKMAKNSYSSFGSIPKITGGEFIVGEFAKTLPKFFSKKRPLASLINFDADLYSSTLCALNYSNKVIDEKTILIFDEFLINKNWENDEYKALTEFCNNCNLNYKVLAVSFLSKQVAVKLIKNV